MTALFKFGDTIYQRTVKLNVRALTELRAHRGEAMRSAESITNGVCAEEKRMQFPLVQASCSGTRKASGGSTRCAADGTAETSLPVKGAWPVGPECVNVRTGNPAVIGTCVP